MITEQELDRIIDVINTSYGSVGNYLKGLLEAGEDGIFPDTEPIAQAKAILAQSMLDSFHEAQLVALIRNKLEVIISAIDEVFGDGIFLLLFTASTHEAYPGYFRLLLSSYELLEMPKEKLLLKVPYFIYSGENLVLLAGKQGEVSG